jgi:hypothetical protein
MLLFMTQTVEQLHERIERLEHLSALQGAAGVAPMIQSGTTTLVAGVSPAIAATITAGSEIVVSFRDAISGVNANTAKLEVPVATRAVGAPGSFVIQANTIADVVNNTDVSTVDWLVIG